MSKEDWIILRLCRHLARAGLAHRDTNRSVMHLIAKYGGDMVLECVDQLNEEEM